jgi:hypothetical protein
MGISAKKKGRSSDIMTRSNGLAAARLLGSIERSRRMDCLSLGSRMQMDWSNGQLVGASACGNSMVFFSDFLDH